MTNLAIFWINAVLASICVASFIIMQEVEEVVKEK